MLSLYDLCDLCVETSTWNGLNAKHGVNAENKQSYSCYSCNSWLKILVRAFDGFGVADSLKDERRRDAEETKKCKDAEIVDV